MISQPFLQKLIWSFLLVIAFACTFVWLASTTTWEDEP